MSTPVTEFRTWTQLVTAIDESTGVVKIPMEVLRQLEGAQRLGVHVLTSIIGRLATLGIGHMPESLPNRQDKEVILYRYGTPASEVVQAIRNGLTGAVSEGTYKALYQLNAAQAPNHFPEIVPPETMRPAAQAFVNMLAGTDVSDSPEEAAKVIINLLDGKDNNQHETK
jgi:hypothetical protein